MRNELIKILSEFTKDDIIKIEQGDPQFIALKKLYEKISDKELFIKLVITNALISYQLQTTGEKYWQNFSDFFSKNNKSLEDFFQFIKIYNKRLINLRKKRLQKILKCMDKINSAFIEKSKTDIFLMLKFLSKCLNQKEDAKTIVFAIKMFLYALDIVYQKHHFSPFGIMIPLDSRIKKISADKNFWLDVEKQVKIPLLHIDSLLWRALSQHPYFPKLTKLKNFLL